jgi:single-strand DNA-binding protein
MSSMNRVILMGRLTRDPALTQIPTGSTKADLGLAISETRRGKDGQTTETVCFIDVVAWEKTAQLCGQFLTKGAPVAIEGRLQFDSWTGKDGQKRSKVYVRADRVHFIGKPPPARAESVEEGFEPAEEEAPPVETRRSAAPAAPARPVARTRAA